MRYKAIGLFVYDMTEQVGSSIKPADILVFVGGPISSFSQDIGYSDCFSCILSLPPRKYREIA
jgi:hypothetical protein